MTSGRQRRDSRRVGVSEQASCGYCGSLKLEPVDDAATPTVRCSQCGATWSPSTKRERCHGSGQVAYQDEGGTHGFKPCPGCSDCLSPVEQQAAAGNPCAKELLAREGRS